MELGDEMIRCVTCCDVPRNAVLLQCYNTKAYGGSRNNACKPFFCGTCVRGSSCINKFLASAASKKDYVRSKWTEGEQKLEFLDELNPNNKRKIADCPLCKSDIRGAQAMPVHRTYYNSLKSQCPIDMGCMFEGDHGNMIKHIAQVHGVHFEQEDLWDFPTY